jgi:hypothetical protein
MPTTQQVAIVRHVSECDVREITGTSRMPYPQALAWLRQVARVAPREFPSFDLVYVQADGTLGRYASWSV